MTSNSHQAKTGVRDAARVHVRVLPDVCPLRKKAVPAADPRSGAPAPLQQRLPGPRQGAPSSRSRQDQQQVRAGRSCADAHGARGHLRRRWRRPPRRRSLARSTRLGPDRAQAGGRLGEDELRLLSELDDGAAATKLACPVQRVLVELACALRRGNAGLHTYVQPDCFFFFFYVHAGSMSCERSLAAGGRVRRAGR